ncbi:MAG: LamG domain-containing protein [Microgenomates group bacterium]
MPKKKNIAKKSLPKYIYLVIILVGGLLFGLSKAKKAAILQVSEISPFPFSKAIKLNTGDVFQEYVEIPNNANQILKSDFTIEAWIKPEIQPRPFKVDTRTYTILEKNTTDYSISGGVNPLYSIKMYVQQEGYLPNPITVTYTYKFSVLGESCGKQYMFSSPTYGKVLPEKFNSWKHIAAVRSGKKLMLFENGVLLQTPINVPLSTLSCDTSPAMTIGMAKDRNKPMDNFKGLIDEVRISSIPRYTAKFTPPKKPFTRDANTVALYHMNSNLIDDSNNVMNGIMHGTANYVDSDIVTETIPLPSPTCIPLPVCLKNKPCKKVLPGRVYCSPPPVHIDPQN